MVENEAALVRSIFGWVTQECVSLAMVCQRLFEAGVPDPTGNARWKRSMVSVLLTNPAYADHARFGKPAAAPGRAPLRYPAAADRAVEPLGAAVWAEVCRLLENPARVTEEHQCRLQAVRIGPRRPELETVERQLTKLRGGIDRLIDIYPRGNA